MSLPAFQRRKLAWVIAVLAGTSLLLHVHRASRASLLRPELAPARSNAIFDVETRFLEDAVALSELLENWPEGKPRATIFMLARNKDAQGVVQSLTQLEASFGSEASTLYPYIIVNNEDFSLDFIQHVESHVKGRCYFGRVPKQHWDYPAGLNASAVAAALAAQEEAGVFHGGMESYHFMCRYFSGFFMFHPLLEGFEYYWRVEPDVFFYCHLQEDPFQTMRDKNTVYGWNIVRIELMSTIPSLWQKTLEFLHAHPTLLHPRNSLRALAPAFKGLHRGGWQLTLSTAPYSGCHYWSNFEIGRLAFFRSEAYQAFFASLEASGGFFLERWGDAPVHTLAVAALLDGGAALHRYDDIGYRHDDATHCPQSEALAQHCSCMPATDYNQHEIACITLQRSSGLL